MEAWLAWWADHSSYMQLCVVEEPIAWNVAPCLIMLKVRSPRFSGCGTQSGITHGCVQISEKLEDTIRNVYKCFRNGLS